MSCNMVANATWEEAQDYLLRHFGRRHTQVICLALKDAGINNLAFFFFMTDEELKELFYLEKLSKNKLKLKLGPRKYV